MELRTPLTGSIKLRELQRDTKKICGFLSTNPGNFLNVINGRGEVLYCVTSKDYLRQSLEKEDEENKTSVATLNDETLEMFQNMQGQLEELTSLVKQALNY